jgi:hypothetical protein
MFKFFSQVEVFQDHCTARRVTVTRPGLLRYLNAIFGEAPTRTHQDKIFAYVAELQRGAPIAETYPRKPGTSGGGDGGRQPDACDAEARALLSDRSSKLVMVPMVRHSSQHMVQYGFVQVPTAGQVCLAWDNSYSRVRSKELTLHYEVADGGGTGQPPARWAAGPMTVMDGTGGGRGNLIASGGKKDASSATNAFMKNLNFVKSLLEQVKTTHCVLFVVVVYVVVVAVIVAAAVVVAAGDVVSVACLLVFVVVVFVVVVVVVVGPEWAVGRG